MLKLNLNGQWQLRRSDSSETITANIPGSVYSTLLYHKKIEDPYYKDNEEEVKKLSEFDYEFSRSFMIDESLFSSDILILKCYGLDTICDVFVNGQFVDKADNMHRTYAFNIKNFVTMGENHIKILFHSPLKYIAQKHAQNPIWGADTTVEGFSQIRKAHYMFGWDWGPKLPDMGIWRDIEIQGFNFAKLDDIYITQKHSEGAVSLNINVKSTIISVKSYEIEVNITCPDGTVISKEIETNKTNEDLIIDISNPELWWPNGFGAHPLYKVSVTLKKCNTILDTKEFNIGLRTLTIRNEKDQWGESFEFFINGISIFGNGANYIPEDCILSNCTKERTERLIKDCIDANFNCIRVWGGGFYPEDYFYDLCDEYGLIVWQDLMYACAVYEMTDDFAANIKKETEDNVKRLRHHASLGLWCGNNEMEVAWHSWGFPQTAKLKTDYIKQFEVLLPSVVKENDPNTFYWLSSPSSGGGFDNPNDENRGDTHYWDIWHGLKPFDDYRNHYFRFTSEFGFESFPSVKTIKAYTTEEDLNPFSYIMDYHQRCNGGNGKIMYYISQYFKYPTDFESFVYVSQLSQAEAIRYGVEFWRQNRGRCMGATYWQLNDCWGTASWASIDYYGRWKALHYFAKRFFAPVLISANQNDSCASIYITNESLNKINGTILWKLRKNDGTIVREGSKDVTAEPLKASLETELDFTNVITEKGKQEIYLEYSFICGNEALSYGTMLFVPTKYFKFINPEISFSVSETKEEFILTLKAKNFAKYVELDFKEKDAKFSDNYFDMSPDTEKIVKINKKDLTNPLTLEEINKTLCIKTIYNIS